MNTQLLIELLQLASANSDSTSFSKTLSKLALQIALDPELGNEVVVNSFDNEFYNSFDNEFYSAKSLNYIKECFNFQILNK